jgi:ubiquinone/menaquinone biosynthesis C-methylase UbiE
MENPVVTENEGIVREVRDRYASIARTGGSCCGPSPCGCSGAAEVPVSLGIGYQKDELEAVPDGANLGLGCGAPIGRLALRPGETVLDLGSGPGLDAFLAARAVGPEGRVIGVDMTPEMIERARANARKAGLTNVEFRQGRIEALPVDDASVDAVTSNCVINLVPDKARVFREVARVLKPGGRLVISDIVLDGPLPEAVEKDVTAYVGCISGATQREDYLRMLRDAGLRDVEILLDMDQLAGFRDAAPAEVDELLARTGACLADVEGRVRSLTVRARKV